MRKVKVAAIQPGSVGIPDEYNCLSENFRDNPCEILYNYINKRLDVTIAMLEKAGQEGCDIVTTCEDVAGISAYIAGITEKKYISGAYGAFL